MRRWTAIFLVLVLGGPAAAGVPPLASVAPTLQDWVRTQARATLDSPGEPDPAVIARNARARLDGQAYSDADIEGLVQLVLAEASRQAEADLRGMTEQMRAANERKARQREQAAALKASRQGLTTKARDEYASAGTSGQPTCAYPCRVAVAPVAASQGQLTMVAPTKPGALPPADGGADSGAELGQARQLQMQLAMDRMARTMQTLSNLMKKSADTQSTVTSNLK